MVDCITDEPARGAIGDLRPFQTSGLEGARRLIRGELPGLPMSRLVGMRVTDAGLGKATFSMPMTNWLDDGFGLKWAGIFAMFADSPLAVALWTGLPAGRVSTTSELNMSFVRPVTSKTANIVGRAETIHLGSQVGLSSIQISDQDGRLLAFGSTRCLIVDVPVDPDAEYPAPDTGPDDPPDPYLREPPTDGYFSLDEILDGVPIELERKALRGEIVFPIARVTGVRVMAVEPGFVEMRLPTSPWFSNSGPAIYGGILAWLAEFTMGSAVYSELDPGDGFATLDLNVRFTRPAVINDGGLTAQGQVRHKGNRLRVSSAEITNSQGKRVAMATSSALIVRGGARALTEGRLPDEILQTVE